MALRAHLDGKVNCDVNKCVLDVDMGRVSFEYRAFIDLLVFSYEMSGTRDLDWTNPIKILHKEFESPLNGLIK